MQKRTNMTIRILHSIVQYYGWFASLQWGSEVSVFNHPNINCFSPLFLEWASPVTEMVKNPPVMQETGIWSLGWKDPLEKRLATHSSIFAWRIPWTEEPGRLESMGLQKVGHNWATNTFTFRLHIHIPEHITYIYM